SVSGSMQMGLNGRDLREHRDEIVRRPHRPCSLSMSSCRRWSLFLLVVLSGSTAALRMPAQVPAARAPAAQDAAAQDAAASTTAVQAPAAREAAASTPAASTPAAQTPAAQEASEAVPAAALIVPIEAVVGTRTRALVTRGIREVRDRGARLLVLEIRSPGGYLDAMMEVNTLLATLQAEDVQTIAYIDEYAFSAAAMIALACDRIYIRPGAAIGA